MAREARRRDCKKQKIIVKQSLTAYGGAPFTQGSLTLLPPKNNSHLAFQRSHLRFFFCPCRPKRKSLAKRKRPRESFARCDARGGLRALHLRPLAWGLQSAVARRVVAACCAFLLLSTIRQHSVGRGFEEVHERAGHKPKSVLHKRRAKTPLCYIKKGSTLFALPSEGTNILFWGIFGGCGGLFSKSPPQKPRVFFKSPLEKNLVPFPLRH